MIMMKKLAFLSIAIAFIGNSCKVNDKKQTVEVKVDLGQTIATMQGGIGASWHAINHVYPLHNEKYKYPIREIGALGSAHEGNPPTSSVKQWEQLYNHASYLEFSFVRAEILFRMFEPQKDQYSWDNEEMNALYKILDWCEANKADAFLQIMGNGTDWNSYPGVHPLLSAPLSVDAFAQGIGNLLTYLTNTKKYTCIKYIVIANEPTGGTFGYWYSKGDKDVSILPALKSVRNELTKRNLTVKLSGPDWTDLPPFVESSAVALDSFVQSYDLHSYHGVSGEGYKNFKQWVEWAHARHKPIFLSEFGNMNLGWGKDNPGPKTFAASISNASDIINSLNLGVDAFNRWSFVNRGDIDGQWQLIQTYDRKNKKYLDSVVIEKEAYYGYAVITKFLSKNSEVLLTSTDTTSKIVAAAVKSPKGDISVYLVNTNSVAKKVNLTFSKVLPNQLFYFYSLTKEIVNKPGFQLKPSSKYPLSKGSLQLEVPGNSISTLSTKLL
jgi:hypothetical protein